MAKIHLDIDDTLADTTSAFIEYMEVVYNLKISRDILKMHAYNEMLFEIVGKNIDFFKEFEKSEFHSRILPYKNAQKIISLLAQKNQLFVISGRSLNLKEKTKEWVNKYFPGCISEVHLVNQYPREGEEKFSLKKHELAKQLNCTISIDDDPNLAIKLSELGVKVILFTQPWNEKTYLNGSIKRVNNWDEVLKLLK